jgi:hypothetical protein
MELTTKMMLELTEKVTRLRAALQLLKVKIKNDKEGRTGDRRALLNEEELNEVLEVAGMLEDDVNVIKFENADEVAYREGDTDDTV